MAADSSEIIAISKLLGKSTPPQVRKPALDLILGTSLHVDGLSLFSAENFALLDGLCQLLPHLQSDERLMVNIAAESTDLSNRILESDAAIKKCVEECVQKSSCLLRSAQLLANVSRHNPEKFHATVSQYWADHIAAIFGLLMNASSNIEEPADYLGYMLMNLSTLHVVRQAIVTNHLPKLLPLFTVSSRVKRKLCAVNVVYNISFEDGLHSSLLLDNDDEFLCAIVAPLVDEEYELSEEETAKLPLQLQYYDRKREEDVTICQKLVETLYQLCATKLGRETLRTKGIYPLLRELDRAISKQSPWIKETSNIGGDRTVFENTLHSLIGILIRYESEMEVPNDAFSLRELE